MSKENNLTDFLTDVAGAIREKKGTTEKINPQDFSNEIKGISTSMWTGHVDVEGLKAIGWDDEDIAYYQKHGVNWMEEDDEYHKVSEDNKALYGVINRDNISNYKDSLEYIPKFDGTIETYNGLSGFKKLIGIPLNMFGSPTTLYYTFNGCEMLYYVPPIDTSECTRFNSTFRNCTSLTNIPFDIYTDKAGELLACFYRCTSLQEIQEINTTSATDIRLLFGENYSLKRINGVVDVKGLNTDSFATSCFSLIQCKFKNVGSNFVLNSSCNISKESILYMINNEAATSAVTITLQSKAYARLSTDPDIVEALSNHPLVSLASA